ncbi:hypothetical protein QN277_028724 [Acacia crassicarpa]|uniref:Retrotransposon gag domain-containing protein n=1 Tax=Acacia crassicarpa TaxID=499986 RepID=A0AAE1MFG3_9FABA|nr:hypothetical protein QN277_028724 [Acacia crassicarpa]
MRNSPAANLEPYDPEIDRTYKQRRRKQKQRSQLVGTASMAEAPNDHDREQQERIAMHRENQDPPPNVDGNKAIMEFGIPDLNKLTSAIIPSTLQAGHFEIKSVMIQMLNAAGQFRGLPSEDPHLHLKTFLEVCDSFVIPSIPPDTVRIKLFPFSLRDKARTWLNNLPANSITTWNDLESKFSLKFFPPIKNAQLRGEITTFQQKPGESTYDAWDRFKDILRRCPQHGLVEWVQIETFYKGLDTQTRSIVDASSGGSLLMKSYDEAYNLLERMAINSHQWQTDRSTPSRTIAGIHELDAMTALTTQVSTLTNVVKGLTLPPTQLAQVACVHCGGDHSYAQCLANPESVNFVNNFNRGGNANNSYSNTYNPGWRQHPNFSWNSQGAQGTVQPVTQQFSNRAPNPPGFTQPARRGFRPSKFYVEPSERVYV